MAILKYGPGGTSSVSTDGGKTWTSGNYSTDSTGSIINSDTGQKVSQPTTSSSSSSSGSSNVISGATNSKGQSFDLSVGSGMNQWSNIGSDKNGTSYAVSNNNNTIAQTVNGQTSIINKSDPNYNDVWNAMTSGLKDNGVNYTPTYTTTVHRDVVPTGETVTNFRTGETYDGYAIDWDKPETFKTLAFTPGNEKLQADMETAAKTNGTGSVGLYDFVKDVYNNGTSKEDIDKTLGDYGLDAFNSQNAIYTAGQNVLPGGEAVKNLGLGSWEQGDAGISVNGNPQGGLYYTYGGQTYLMGGDSANLAQYANGMTNNWTNADYILGNPQNNPLVQQNPDLYNSVLQNQYAYGTANGQPATGTQQQPYNLNINQSGSISYTGNPNVDGAISNINSVLDYAIQTGDSDLYNSIKQLLDNGLNTTQEWLATQKSQAEANAEKQARGARINQLLQQQAMNEAYSAAGIGTTGAVQSGMQAINDSYGKSLGDINTNLANMLNNLNDQELKALSDYYQNLGQYKYNITNDDLNRQYQLAQMAQNEAQFQQNLALEREQLAQRQAQQELENQWNERAYADSQAATQAQNAQNAWDNAYKMASAGIINESVANALGMSVPELQSWYATYSARQ